MPIYDYRCNECGSTYDVFHKVREVADDIICPSCGSSNHTRLISASTFSMNGKSGHAHSDAPPCADGSCCGGTCGLN